MAIISVRRFVEGRGKEVMMGPESRLEQNWAECDFEGSGRGVQFAFRTWIFSIQP